MKLDSKTKNWVPKQIYDALGSVAATTSATGTTGWSYGYGAYGEAITATKIDPAAPANPYRYTGEYLDPTGLYHVRARQYDPATGRFGARDPLAADPGQPYVSAYAYAGDRPTVATDPTGMRPEGGEPEMPMTPISTTQRWSAFRHFISQLEIINSVSSSNDFFIRTAARRLGGFDAGRFGLGPPGLPEGASRADIPYEIIGSSGWRADLIDDDGPAGASPARHFVGFLAAGYFHPHTADDQLEINEGPGRDGASLQDRRSGNIAIALGIQLRRGHLTRPQLIVQIEQRAGDPNNIFNGNRPSQDVGDNPPLACYLPLAPC